MAGRSRLTFIIHSETLTGADITAWMNLQPTAVTDKGDPISRRNPTGARRTHTTWQLAGPLPETEELAAHLKAMLPLIEPRTPALTQLRSTGASAVWSCFVTAKPGGNLLWLQPPLLARLTAVGATLAFDIYDSD